MKITSKDIDKKFRVRNGEIVTIVDYWDNRERPVIGMYQYDIDEQTHDVHSWNDDGRHNVKTPDCLDSISELDLVERLED